ncbi:hypothetical protein IWW45_005708 [Coemansia sp. RSA 485]|nr:hypothetical protein IWW45_005708 [Coemansia sp. RSA 485]
MSDKDGSDEHYTRIQEMIDSLIKDADSALNSKPARHHHHQQQQSSVHSDDSTDLQLSCDPLCSPEQLSSVSTVFDDAPPAYLSPSFSRRPATRHAASSYKTPEIYPKRPMSAMSMSSKSSRSRRYRPQTPVSKPRVLDTDPSEADAESDTELGSINASGSRPKSSYNVNGGRSHGRRQEASVNSSDLYAHINYSARHAFSSQQHQPQHNRHMYSRYRSDTLDSFMSNSSETCVSPGNRYSREFYRAPATSQTYTGAGVLVDSLCTPTRRGFNFDFNTNPDAHSSALAGSNVPLIRRVRNSFARAVLRSASLVDDSINDDIAALPSDPRWSAESPSSRVLRHRSNTVDSDYSPSPESAMRNDSYRESSAQNSIFNHQARFVDDRDCYSSLPSHLHPPNSGSGPMPGSPSGLWSRRRGENNSGYEASHNHLPSSHNAKYQSDSLGSNVRSDRECQLSALRIDTSNVDGSQIRRPDSIEEYDSSSGVASISALSSGRELVGCTSPASASSSNSDESASGLFGIISLFYWTLLFTLGALMLDSFLCQVAGKRVMGTVDKIAQSENLIDSPNSKNKGKGSRSKNLTISHSNNADTKSNADVANTVGRFRMVEYRFVDRHSNIFDSYDVKPDIALIELGAMFRREVEADFKIDQVVADTLSRLWFLVVQPPDKFGHIANVSVEASRFIFSGSAANAAVRAVDIMNIEFTDEERSCLVNIGDKIDRRIRVLGRLAHIYNVKYGDKRAFLKLSWIKPDKYLEGALYDVLQQSAIDGIPAVYSSGVLCKDSFDYQLEYLLLEDCGETVWDIIRQFVGKKVTMQKIYRVVPLVIKNVMRYLLRAHSAGVMHRDISSGNISIRENDVFIIDWGCSRLVTNGSEDQNKLFNQLAAKWDFKLKEIIDKEKMRDPLTGTHEYMSIRVLLGTAERNIFDDIESLFYVVLHLLQCAKKEQVTDFLDTRHMSNYVSAVLKVGNMCGPQFYQKRAGIETYPDDLLQMVDNLYNMLFMVDGVNICSKLLDCAPEMRKLDCHLLCSIIGKDAFDDIFPSHVSGSSGDAIEPSSIGVISAFSQSESTDATKALGKRKAEEESDENDDAFYKKFKDLPWLQFY